MRSAWPCAEDLTSLLVSLGVFCRPNQSCTRFLSAWNLALRWFSVGTLGVLVPRVIAQITSLLHTSCNTNEASECAWCVGRDRLQFVRQFVGHFPFACCSFVGIHIYEKALQSGVCGNVEQVQDLAGEDARRDGAHYRKPNTGVHPFSHNVHEICGGSRRQQRAQKT